VRPLLAAGDAARDGWAPVVEGGAAAAAPRGGSLGVAPSRLGGSVTAAAAAAAAQGLRPLVRGAMGRGRWAAWQLGGPTSWSGC